MIIEKVINNNIISAYDEDGKEVIVMGRGLGFGGKPGKPVDESKIEKVFHIKSRSIAEQFKELMERMPLEHVQISNDIISYAKQHLKLKLSQSIYVTLTDHINFTVERYKQGIRPENALLWEIKCFYSREYELGKYAVRIMKERLGLELPDDEAGFVALHFVNAEYGTELKDALNFPQLLGKIIRIVTEELGIELDDRSLHYERFVTHVKFLIQRVYRKELLKDELMELKKIMSMRYPEEYSCSQKIADYIEKQSGTRISEEEITYLTIHIRRITSIET